MTNELYYVSEKTYKKLYNYCATKLLSAEMKNANEAYADAAYFKSASSEYDYTDFRELERLFDIENIPTDSLETIESCPTELLPKVISESLQKFVVGRGENIKPGAQLVSRETYFYILADVAETLLFDLLSKHDAQGVMDADYGFYEWFNKRIDTSASNISEMIVRDGASPRLIVELCNRAENYEEVIVEILNTFRVKPF